MLARARECTCIWLLVHVLRVQKVRVENEVISSHPSSGPQLKCQSQAT